MSIRVGMAIVDEIRNHRFIRQNFKGETWKNRFINCEFIFCTFSNSDFSESEFCEVSGYGNKVENLNKFPKNYRLDKDGVFYGPQILDLREAILTDCYFNAKNWSNSKLFKVNMYGTTFFECDLTNADLNSSNIENVTFENCNLTGATFKQSKLAKVNFRGCTIDKVEFLESVFHDVRFNWAQGEISSLPSDFSIINGVMFGPGANITSTTIGNADLRNINLNGIISGGVIGNPILPTGWKMAKGYLIGPGADLSNADLTGSNLEDMSLEFTKLDNAQLFGVSSKLLTGTPSLPQDYQIIGGFLIGPDVVLKDCDISHLDLSTSNLDGVMSENVIAERTILPRGWSLVNGYLVGKKAKVGKADLSNQILFNTDISEVDFSGCNFEGLKGFSLRGKYAELPDNWQLSNGILIGPTANVSELDLSGTDLSGIPLAGPLAIRGKPSKLPPKWKFLGDLFFGPKANLKYLDIQDLDLSEIDLEGVSSGNLVGSPKKLPSGWELLAGYLVGPGADLRFANLSGCDLRGVNLDGADLADADLSNCTIGPGVGRPARLPKNFFNIENGFIGPQLILSGIQITHNDSISSNYR